jgi:hypothetical protein
MRNNIILLPFGSNGLIGAVFASIGSLELPKAKSSPSPDPAEVETPIDHSNPPMFEHRVVIGSSERLSTYDGSAFATNTNDEAGQGCIRGEHHIPELESSSATWTRSMTTFEIPQQIDLGYEPGNYLGHLGHPGLEYDDAEMIRQLTAEGLAEVSMHIVDYSL